MTETAHEPPPGIEPFARLTEPAPPPAVRVPLQVLLALGFAATTRPFGNVSVKATPLSARLALLFVMLNVSVVVPFNGIELAVKLLVMDGAEPTVRLADAVLPVPPLVDVTAPGGIVCSSPKLAPVTVTLNWHCPPAAMVALVNWMPVGAVSGERSAALRDSSR